MRKFDILFICSANVGRSQMAEGYYNAQMGKRRAISAGINDFTMKYNGKPAPEIIAIMRADGVDISTQSVKKLESNMLSYADKVIILCDKSECPDFLLKDKKVEFLKIEDPYQKGEEELLQIRSTIKEFVETLFNRKNTT
jgi:arsenate reductase (thioredoxin)